MTVNLIKSYVWFEGNCFFVSTIERDSSCMEPTRIAETIVWEYDYHQRMRENLIYEDTQEFGNFSDVHFSICKRIFDTGTPVL